MEGQARQEAVPGGIAIAPAANGAHPRGQDPAAGKPPYLESTDYVRVRFAGDSGDGMQLTGAQLARSSSLHGLDLATFPDFPAEIRAPAGTVHGVSSYSINFGSCEIQTAGDYPDILVAMNPAALKLHLGDVRAGGLLIADRDAFREKALRKAGFDSDPLDDGTLGKKGVRLLAVGMTEMTAAAVKEAGLPHNEALRCKNMWALGLVLWMFSRDLGPVEGWLDGKFGGKPEVALANRLALRAGHAFGETAEIAEDISPLKMRPAEMEPGEYCSATGSEALAWGLLAGAKLAGLELFFGSYPITPASPMLHEISRFARKDGSVVAFQAEDEISAACAAIGASWAGALGATASSGPGLALKGEAIGFAVAAELPLVIVNTQRGGPSTGLPTKTEQSDLFQAIAGRHGDAPLPVLAASGPADCFSSAIEASRMAVRFMTPVILLSDGYLANATEPWRIPDLRGLDPFPVDFAADPEGFTPMARDPETLGRVWAKPGTPGLEHRIGSLEKDHDTGEVSYDPENHQRMTDLRARKIRDIAGHIPLQRVACGTEKGDLAVVTWGSTFGPAAIAIRRARDEGLDVAHVHVRHLNPMPKNLGELLGGFGKVIVPEMNTGQLAFILRARYLLPVESVPKVTGRPFRIAELGKRIREALGK